MPDLNMTINESVFTNREIVTKTHAISGWEIILISAVFVFLAYWYIKVTKNREQYEAWTNPNGRVVNLYKSIRRIFWWYVVLVIILGITQILLV